MRVQKSFSGSRSPLPASVEYFFFCFTTYGLQIIVWPHQKTTQQCLSAIKDTTTAKSCVSARTEKKKVIETSQPANNGSSLFFKVCGFEAHINVYVRPTLEQLKDAQARCYYGAGNYLKSSAKLSLLIIPKQLKYSKLPRFALSRRWQNCYLLAGMCAPANDN